MNSQKKKENKYKCVQCQSISVVSVQYLSFAYVKALCCSVHCYNKITYKENTQEGAFELIIS